MRDIGYHICECNEQRIKQPNFKEMFVLFNTECIIYIFLHDATKSINYLKNKKK